MACLPLLIKNIYAKQLVVSQLLYEQLRHRDIRHFVIIECRHLAIGCVLKCGCIGLKLFRNLSCLGTIICYINTIGIVPAYVLCFRFDLILLRTFCRV